MNTVFVDTSYFIALELRSDQYHGKAREHWRRVMTNIPPLMTTSYIFDEVVTFFNSRGHHAKAVQIGVMLLNSPSIQLIQVDEALFNAGWIYFQHHQDKDYSLTDCISFIVMHTHHITTAFTFDNHFTQAGYVQEP